MIEEQFQNLTKKLQAVRQAEVAAAEASRELHKASVDYQEAIRTAIANGVQADRAYVIDGRVNVLHFCWDSNRKSADDWTHEVEVFDLMRNVE